MQNTVRVSVIVKNENFHYPFLHFLSLSGSKGIQPRQTAIQTAIPATEPTKEIAVESHANNQERILQNIAKPLF